MNIYFVRHGVTDGNDALQYQFPDTPLSERGVKQAHFLGSRFETIPVDCIITSTMQRARQTARIISEHTGLPINELELFEEIKRPSIVRGRFKKDPEVVEIMKQIRENFTNSEWTHSDEENFHKLRDRAAKALESLSQRPEENVLVVTHGEFLRMMLCVITFWENLTPEIYERMKDVFVPFNTGITKVNYDPRLGYNQTGWYIHTWNDHAHLGAVN